MRSMGIEIHSLTREQKLKLISLLTTAKCKLSRISTAMDIGKKNYLIINSRSGEIYFYENKEFAKAGEDMELEITVDEIKHIL